MTGPPCSVLSHIDEAVAVGREAVWDVATDLRPLSCHCMALRCHGTVWTATNASATPRGPGTWITVHRGILQFRLLIAAGPQLTTSKRTVESSRSQRVSTATAVPAPTNIEGHHPSHHLANVQCFVLLRITFTTALSAFKSPLCHLYSKLQRYQPILTTKKQNCRQAHLLCRCHRQPSLPAALPPPSGCRAHGEPSP